MFANLIAEQRRRGLTDAALGEVIGVSRWAYRRRLRSGRFTPEECRVLCRYFGRRFDTLFAEAGRGGAR